MVRAAKIAAAVALVAAGGGAGVAIGVSAGGGSHNSAAGHPPASPRVSAPPPATTVPAPAGKTSTHAHGTSAKFAPTSAAPPQVQPPAGLPDLTCPASGVTVSTAEQLKAALAGAHAGTVIHLADGVYAGRFGGSAAGTEADPIWVCGGPMAILDDGQSTSAAAPPQGDGYYGFHLLDSSWWNLVGFSVRNSQKGVMLDHTDHTTLYRLTVYNIGDEAIHLRSSSSDDLVEGCVVRTTGLRVAKFGEGVYVGTAIHNWSRYSGGQPDASDRDTVAYNDVSTTTAENVDIKEGTVGGVIAFNHFDGTGMSPGAASSWVNVKGNGYSVHDNTGENSLGDGFSTHKIVAGDGTGNTFGDNHVGANVAGYGFAFYSKGNVLECNNTGEGQKGRSNVSCSQ